MLPTSKTKPTRTNPKRLIIYGKPKIGKTTMLSLLDDCLILDLESGTEHIEALKQKIIGLTPEPDESKELKLARINKPVPELYLSEFITLVKRYYIANNAYPYKYIAVDTVSQLEEWCVDHATLLYMNSVQGKQFNRDPKTQKILPKDQWENVLTLPNGAGYRWLRDSFNYWLNEIDNLADNIIFAGHVRDKSITKMGKQLDVADLDLTGKISSMLSAASDAIAYIYRKNNETILNFNGQDITTGSRCNHLKGKEITVMKEDSKTGELESFWDEIYPDK